ncbi:MAG: hypothetical protein Q9160_008193 [Pyrenula sp. 1 TL-2023]
MLAPETTFTTSTSPTSAPLPASALLPPSPARAADIATASPLPQPSTPIDLVIHDFLTDDSASTTSSCPAAANQPRPQIVIPNRTSSLQYRCDRDRQHRFKLSVAPNDSISQISRRRRTSAPERPAPMFGTNKEPFIHNWLDTITVDEGEKHSTLSTNDIRPATLGNRAGRKWSGMLEWEHERLAAPGESRVTSGDENQKKNASAHHYSELPRPPVAADNIAGNTYLDAVAFGQRVEELRAKVRELWYDWHQQELGIERIV